jgi:hypothetical protein
MTNDVATLLFEAVPGAAVPRCDDNSAAEIMVHDRSRSRDAGVGGKLANHVVVGVQAEETCWA